MSEQTDRAGWSRGELTLRLTARRVANLRAIAAGLPGEPSPTETIDHAIATSLGEPAAANERLLDIETALREAAADQRGADASVDARLSAIERSLASLLALISEAANSEDAC